MLNIVRYTRDAIAINIQLSTTIVTTTKNSNDSLEITKDKILVYFYSNKKNDIDFVQLRDW